MSQKITDFFSHKKELGWKCPFFFRRVGLKMSRFPSAASAENVPLLYIAGLISKPPFPCSSVITDEQALSSFFFFAY